MKKVAIKTRILKDREIDLLTSDIRHFPDLIYVSKDVWKKQKVNVVEVKGFFAGVLVAYEFGDWVKLGPLVILRKHQKRGLGKTLLKTVINKYRNKNIFLNTTNPHVAKSVMGYGFNKIPNYLSHPTTVKIFLIKQFFNYLGIKNITEAIRKALLMPRAKRKYFIKLSA